MMMELLVALWATICAAFATVAVMRGIIGRREDDHLHFADSEQQLVTVQSGVAHKLDVLDRWRAVLLALTVVLAIVIGALHFYTVWRSTGTGVAIS